MFCSNKTQKLADEILKKHIAASRVSQAYFFTGEELNFDPETGFSRKEEFVYEFAARLAGGTADIENRLRRLREDKHPDIMRLGADREENSVKIESVRNMLEWASLKPFESDRRVGVICRAERLTDQAGNAFLKTLEEAPGQTVFCLLAPSRDLVLETIRSRCFEVRFPETPVWNPAASAALPPFREMLENYSDLGKADLKPALELVLESLRGKMVKATADLNAVKPLLKAFEIVRQAKQALEANANSKLAMTRMVMQLRSTYPGARGIP